jgi:hypothetical protein
MKTDVIALNVSKPRCYAKGVLITSQDLLYKYMLMREVC